MPMLLHASALYATAILLGAMLFFSFVVAPAVFRTLEADAAARLMRALFPHYYLVIIVLGGSGALALASLERPLPAVGLAAVAGAAVLTRQWLIPRLDALRPAKAAGDAVATRRFRRLHGGSMLLNLLQLAAVAAALTTFVP
jgi:hypothetical protein